MEEKRERVNCMRCTHFYITWDEHHPKGCRALGFKSREMPSSVVFRSSGMVCQMFEEKKARKNKSES